MTETTTTHSARQIENSLLVVEHESPLDTLPYISEALSFMGAFFELNPSSDKPAIVEKGAGLILNFLSLAIDDVQEALKKTYTKK